jgi:hypothetical protein
MIWTFSLNGISQSPAPDPGMGSGWAPEKGQTRINRERGCNRTNEGGERYISENVDNPES